eukprot:8362633-Pyramimonas_sp.AAC.1
MSPPSRLALAMRAAQATSVAAASTPCALGGCSSAAISTNPSAWSRKLPPISPRSQLASSVEMLSRLSRDLVHRPSSLVLALAGSRDL